MTQKEYVVHSFIHPFGDPGTDECLLNLVSSMARRKGRSEEDVANAILGGEYLEKWKRAKHAGATTRGGAE